MVRAPIGLPVAAVRGVPELPSLLESTVALAHEAGSLLMEGFRHDAEVESKGEGGDVVTDYDRRCEALLRERLGALLPGSRGGGEEADDAPGGLAWYVDPIDGTGNFAHGHPWFCLSIGLWDGDAPLVGVVHAPAMGLTHAAAKGHGTRRNGRAVRVSTSASLDAALMATGFPHDRARNPDNNYRPFVTLDARSHGVRRCAAAALELAMVADGAYDGFWDAGLKPWDLAAGILLVQEAGGRVTDFTGAPVRFADAPRLGQIVATNGRIHQPLQDALAHARALPPITQVT